MKSRRIIVLLDGTWNQDDVGGNSSNIVRLRDVIAESLDASDSTTPEPVNSTSLSISNMNARTFAEREHLVFYQRGVGTGPFDQFGGGVFGDGLDVNVRRAYKFLSFHYEMGDEIFIFGFSRGAYTARSLAGYISAVGLLRCETCNAAQESLAWSFYRTSPNDRQPGLWKDLEPSMYPRNLVRVTCLALFDTVGALGVPVQGFRRLNRSKFEFHDVEQSPLVDLALHALAIDEHRRPFEASVWHRNPFKRTPGTVEQVWFPGVHADIGGGYLDDDERNKANERGLDDLALDWMIKRLLAYFPDFPITDLSWSPLPEQAILGPKHDSRTLKYKLQPNTIRSIGNRAVEPRLLSGRDVVVGYDPHTKIASESIHIKAIQRIAEQIPKVPSKNLYTPPNLISCLPDLLSVYSENGPPTLASDALTITAMDGQRILPKSDARCHVFGELRSAWKRLQDYAPNITNRLGWELPDC